MVKLFLAAALLLSMSRLSAQTNDSANYKMTFATVELEASFPGGPQGWAKFMAKNLRYPSKARRKKIEGDVMVQFIVEEDGMLSEIEAISGPHILREAGIEALKKTPKWIPAHQGGRTVRSYKKEFIRFRLPG